MGKILYFNDYNVVKDDIYFEESDLKIHLRFDNVVTITLQGNESKRNKFRYFKVIKAAMAQQKGYKIKYAKPFKVVATHDKGVIDKQDKETELYFIIQDIINECYIEREKGE